MVTIIRAARRSDLPAVYRLLDSAFTDAPSRLFIDQTEGVDHVLSLELIAEGCEPTCGNVCLLPTWLVDAGPHNIEVA